MGYFRDADSSIVLHRGDPLNPRSCLMLRLVVVGRYAKTHDFMTASTKITAGVALYIPRNLPMEFGWRVDSWNRLASHHAVAASVAVNDGPVKIQLLPASLVVCRVVPATRNQLRKRRSSFMAMVRLYLGLVGLQVAMFVTEVVLNHHTIVFDTLGITTGLALIGSRTWLKGPVVRGLLWFRVSVAGIAIGILLSLYYPLWVGIPGAGLVPPFNEVLFILVMLSPLWIAYLILVSLGLLSPSESHPWPYQVVLAGIATGVLQIIFVKVPAWQPPPLAFQSLWIIDSALFAMLLMASWILSPTRGLGCSSRPRGPMDCAGQR